MDYTRLYHLQDEVLSLLGSMDLSLYLTGGTALSRFYLNHRYSEDLECHDLYRRSPFQTLDPSPRRGEFENRFGF